jgi:hypothetical protein
MLAGEFDPSGEVDQAVFAEELAVGVAGLDSAMGVQQQPVAGSSCSCPTLRRRHRTSACGAFDDATDVPPGRPPEDHTTHGSMRAPEPAKPLLHGGADSCASRGLRTRATAVERPARRGPADPLVFYVPSNVSSIMEVG